MSRFLSRKLIWLAFPISILPLGCGDGGPPSGRITGTVSYEGKPVEDGSITVVPADGEGPVVGAKILQGKFTVEGVPPGKKRIEITSANQGGVPKTTAPEKKASNWEPPIPLRAKGNNEVHEIKLGSQTIDFRLTKQ